MKYKLFGFTGLASCTLLAGSDDILETQVFELDIDFGSYQTPEQKLLFAVLLRAYMDAIGIGGHMGYSENWRNKKKQEARDWFRDESYEAFSFPWVADNLDLSDKCIVGLLNYVNQAETFEVTDPVELEALKLRFKFNNR